VGGGVGRGSAVGAGANQVRELILDGAAWQTMDDVYDAFFRAVGAPSWHGRNFNALNDSIATGDINAIEVPYCIVIRNAALAGEGAQQMTRDFIELIQEIAARGCPVAVRVEKPN
jgi:RNAse (barnase) inhibitor barstar